MNREARNLMKFSANFSDKKDVVFPRAYANFTRRDVLVESFHEGSSISDYLENEDVELQEKLARIGMKTILKMVFRDNFIHCDLHPGNILVEADPESTGGTLSWLRRFIDRDHRTIDPRLIILDCGLVVSLNARCQRNLRDVFRSVLLGNVNVNTVMSELFSAMIRHGVKQDGSFSTVILSLAMIESIGRSLYPDMDVFAEVLPFVFTGVPMYDESESEQR
ncbi:putative aarF domain-containing protein kinase 2 [Megalopta genalis]|uniref:putative aarF domain-containing protein kinase 2 n=1 Tax=Megalopta genalis TaxID=115081 RepID=UPI003FD3E2C4